MYLHIEGNKRELNARGQRLANLIGGRVGQANRDKRRGLWFSGEGLVTAIDVLREYQQWTAAAALVEAYGFSEKEFTEAEYAADCLTHRKAP